MPHTITYTSLSNVVPQQRLLMFEKVFQTTDPIELHGAYMWSVKVAASLQPLLSILEVSLRNAIHSSATIHIGPDWYDKLATRVRSYWKTAQRDQSNIKYHHDEIARIKKKISGKTLPKGLKKTDLIVAKLDFGFWDNLLRECFAINGNSKALWPQCMPSVFPNVPNGHTNLTIHTEITALRELRNDIAHHSPVWKHATVHDELSAVTYVNTKIDKIIEIISWLSNDAVTWLSIHMLLAEAKRIASIEFLHLLQRKNINEMGVKPNLLKRNLTKQLKTLKKESFRLISCNGNHMYVLTKITNH